MRKVFRTEGVVTSTRVKSKTQGPTKFEGYYDFREKLDRLNAEIAELDERRDALAHDVNALDSHAINHRNSLSAVLDQLRSLVEDPHLLGEVPLPELRSGSIEDAVAAHARRRGELGPDGPVPMAAAAGAYRPGRSRRRNR